MTRANQYYTNPEVIVGTKENRDTLTMVERRRSNRIQSLNMSVGGLSDDAADGPLEVGVRYSSKRKAAEFIVESDSSTISRSTVHSVSPRRTKTSNLVNHDTKTSDSVFLDNSLSTTSASDPSLGFFYRPHTITLLLSLFAYFLYIALMEESSKNSIDFKTSLLAVAGVFVLIGSMLFPNGPFIRPHPVVWRIVLAMGVCYLLFLVFLLFQSVEQARLLFKNLFDSSLGIPLPEKNYCENCSLTWDNIWDKMDMFVLAHAFGWYLKALVLRDYWILWIISVFFEFMEYLLQFHLPNFAECWWDHWVLDVALCNALGIWAGMKTCDYFEMRTYSWQGWHTIPDIKGRVKRTLQQFTPASWTAFHWSSTRSFKSYLVSLFIITAFLLGELNCFYLKFLLYIPQDHILNGIRLGLILLIGAAGTREAYEYFSNPSCIKLGATAWTGVAILVTEVIIIIKFSRNIFTTPPSTLNLYGLGCFFSFVFVIYPLFQFILVPRWKSTKS
jgi:phosphatidylserine synthase 2